MKQDLVSIIVPVKNGGSFLRETIMSLLNQTYNNVEVIVVDDNSSDDSVEVLKFFLHCDKRIRLLTSVINVYEGGAVNIGWRAANGRFIAIVSADDPQPANWLAAMFSVIRDNPDYVLYYPDRKVINNEGVVTRVDKLHEWNRDTLVGKMICIASCGSVIDRLKLPNDFLPRRSDLILCSDLYQMLLLSDYGDGLRVAGVYGHWRKHDSNQSIKFPARIKVREFSGFSIQWLKTRLDISPRLKSKSHLYILVQSLSWYIEIHGFPGLFKFISEQNRLVSTILKETNVKYFFLELFYFLFRNVYSFLTSWKRSVFN
jgi:glycosyltransferase involved in cell wall biosynthesis